MTGSVIDLSQGVAWVDLPDGGMLYGKLGQEELLLIRRGEAAYAVAAHCSHYNGRLDDGLLVGDTIRCPRHHARFDIRDGQVLTAPALDPIACWRVERVGDMLFVRERASELPPARVAAGAGAPRSIVIIGGGAAGLMAALSLRREGFGGSLALVSSDSDAPYDRPNVSKDFLAGTAPAEWMPLRPAEFYASQRIELLLNTRAASLDIGNRHVMLADGRELSFDSLLLATGAEPVQLTLTGASSSPVLYLRSLSDARRIVSKAAAVKRVAVIGSSFMGLEVTASLRARGIEVDVIGLERTPLTHVLGEQVGRFVQRTHESHGVRFHLGCSVERIDGSRLQLTDGSSLEADLVIAGVGVRPATGLAQTAGLVLDRGILVDEYLQTSAPGVFAAGDAARWPDIYSGERIRVEHWAVAERQGQVAARNMLGRRERFRAVPFFWSQHYDLTINYVGHVERWDSVEIEGELDSDHWLIRYLRAGRPLAVASLGRDLDSLRAELALESAGAAP